MTIQTRTYPDGSSVTQEFPWGLYRTARALCTDGQLRQVKRIATTPDTFFSVPAAVEVRKEGKRSTVAGYVTIDDDGVRFIAHSGSKNGHLLPGTKVCTCGQPGGVHTYVGEKPDGTTDWCPSATAADL